MTKTPCRVGPWQVIRTENTIHTRKAGGSFPPDRRRNRGSYVRFVSGAPNRFDLEGQPVRTGLPLAIEPTADRPERTIAIANREVYGAVLYTYTAPAPGQLSSC